jgi:diguanylate cyclase (GGDEF)-like protein/PAS domain S-box-containing protein
MPAARRAFFFGGRCIKECFPLPISMDELVIIRDFRQFTRRPCSAPRELPQRPGALPAISSSLMPHTPAPHRPRLTLMITLSISATVLVTVLALTGLIDHFARNYAQRQSAVRLQQIAWQMRDSLDRRMAAAVADVNFLAQLPEVRDARSPDEARMALQSLQMTEPDYAWIGLARPDGIVYAATGKTLEGADVSGRNWFRESGAGVRVFDYHPALMLADKLPANNDPWRFVDIASPVAGSNGMPRGILAVHLSWNWTRRMARTLLAPVRDQYQTEVFVVRDDGMILLGPQGTEEKQMAADSFRLAMTGDSGATVESVDGKRYLTGYAMTGMHVEGPGLKWAALVRQPYALALADFHGLQGRIAIAGVALTVALGFLGWLFARHMARPLHRLSTAIERHSLDRSARIPIVSDFHEMHLLSSTLAANAEREQRHLETLHALNESLERTVAERTAELETKAGQLQQALERQHHIQQRLQESEMELRATLQNANDAFIAVDERGRIVEWNGQAERLLGWSRDEAYGKAMADLLFDAELRTTWLQEMERFAACGESQLINHRGEARTKRRDGADIDVELSVGHVPRRDGHLFIVFLHDISERKRLHASLEGMALRDTLTDLPNRRALMQTLPEALARARRIGKPLALFFLDLDGFKGVNDRLGHDAGDELLRLLAQRIVGTVRRTDTVARLAGDEFVVLLELLASADDAVDIADKLLPLLQQPFLLKAGTVALSGSIGIALHAPDAQESVEALLSRADAAMYEAKRSGKNRYRIAADAPRDESRA